MPVTKEETNIAQEIIQILTGNQGEAEAYANEGADKWLDDHGYEGVSAEAVAQAASGYGGGGGGHAAPPPAGAGVEAQLDYVVYNNYYEDNSITNNIENHGNLDFQQVVGDDNITQQAGGDATIGQAQTGEGNVQVGGDVSDSNLEAGEGDQLVDESVNTATNIGDGQAQAGVGGDATQVEVDEGGGEEAPPDDAARPDPLTRCRHTCRAPGLDPGPCRARYGGSGTVRNLPGGVNGRRHGSRAVRGADAPAGGRARARRGRPGEDRGRRLRPRGPRRTTHRSRCPARGPVVPRDGRGRVQAGQELARSTRS